MNKNMLDLTLGEIRHCAMVMFESAMYIEKELPNVVMEDALKEQTKDICSTLVGTKHDVISDLFEIDELVASNAEDGVINSRLDRLMDWMREDFSKIHGLVQKLDAASKIDQAVGLAFLLVMESATNILNAFNQACDSIDAFKNGTEHVV